MTTFNDCWVQQEAINLATKVESVCALAGCHVALTGGCLYKGGFRKDCDLLFYRIRQTENINLDVLWKLLSSIGLEMTSGRRWVFKGIYEGKSVDMFFPEETRVIQTINVSLCDVSNRY